MGNGTGREMGRELAFISRGEGTRTGVGRDADGTDERSAGLSLLSMSMDGCYQEY